MTFTVLLPSSLPLAPAGLPLVALGFLVVQQLVADSAVTVYDVTEVSVRQSMVQDRRAQELKAQCGPAAITCEQRNACR